MTDPKAETATEPVVGGNVGMGTQYLEVRGLTVDFDVPEGLRTAAFPPMMLQSMVENAIKHGLEAKPEGGTLKVRAEVKAKTGVELELEQVLLGEFPEDKEVL